MTSAATGESHGWLVLPSRTGAAVQHLPPRGRDARGRGVEDGTVRVAASLVQAPEALAAVDQKLYLAFPATAARDGTSRRQVLVVEAERGSLDGGWVGEPGGDRLPSVAALPGAGTLRGFVGSPAGPVALLDDGGGELKLLALIGESWSEVALPRGAGGELNLVGTASGVALVATEGEKTGVWSRALSAKAASDAWEWQGLSFADREGGGDARPMSSVFQVRGRWVYCRFLEGRAEVRTVSGSGSTLLATVPFVPAGCAIAPLDQTGRLALVWREAGAAKEGTVQTTERTQIVEVSVLTGQVLFRGGTESQRPFSAFELRLLACFLVTMMLGIVVFVLRPEASPLPVSLPKDVELAEPGRRLVAGLIDAGLAMVIASKLTGVGVEDFLSIKALTGQASALTLYLAAIGVGAVLGTFCEAMFGRTLGKALTGMETVRPVFIREADGQLRATLGRVSIGRALVRNIVKWLLPPVAMSGLSSPERRHRGDTAAGTVVIVRVEDAEG